MWLFAFITCMNDVLMIFEVIGCDLRKNNVESQTKHIMIVDGGGECF